MTSPLEKANQAMQQRLADQARIYREEHKYWVKVVRNLSIIAALVVAALVLLVYGSGCTEDVCEEADTRCDGDVLEICDSDGNWVTNMDCGKLLTPDQVGWKCCVGDEAGEDPNCYPADGCHHD
jgi:hypothetical protein